MSTTQSKHLVPNIRQRVVGLIVAATMLSPQPVSSGSFNDGIDQDMAFAIGDEELEQGLRLICIGSPLSDVVLDA